MNRKVIIIGASGHGKVIADIVRASGDELIGFLDDDASKETLGTTAEWVNFKDAEFVIGIGSSIVREKLSSIPCKWYTAIHPTAVVSQGAAIGEGTVIMPNAVINANAVIGRHCIINSGAIVEHDNKIGDFAHISVGAKLGGTVTIGKSTWVGIGATVSNNVNVCGGCLLGAGATVISDITEPGEYVGVPAKRIK